MRDDIYADIEYLSPKQIKDQAATLIEAIAQADPKDIAERDRISGEKINLERDLEKHKGKRGYKTAKQLLDKLHDAFMEKYAWRTEAEALDDLERERRYRRGEGRG